MMMINEKYIVVAISVVIASVYMCTLLIVNQSSFLQSTVANHAFNLKRVMKKATTKKY